MDHFDDRNVVIKADPDCCSTDHWTLKHQSYRVEKLLKIDFPRVRGAADYVQTERIIVTTMNSDTQLSFNFDIDIKSLLQGSVSDGFFSKLNLSIQNSFFDINKDKCFWGKLFFYYPDGQSRAIQVRVSFDSTSNHDGAVQVRTKGCNWQGRRSELKEDEILMIFIVSFASKPNDYMNKNLYKYNVDKLLDFTSLLETKRFSDFTLAVGDSEIKVHRCILAAASEVFFTMFSKMPNWGEHGRVEIEDFDFNVVEKMLRFIYTGNFEKTDEIAEDVVRIADYYIITSLKTKCEELLSNSLTLENVCSMLAIADKYNCAKLAEDLTNFIVSYKEEVIKTPDFAKTMAAHPMLIAKAFEKMVTKFHVPLKRKLED